MSFAFCFQNLCNGLGNNMGRELFNSIFKAKKVKKNEQEIGKRWVA